MVYYGIGRPGGPRRGPRGLLTTGVGRVFTGLVQCLAEVASIGADGPGARLVVRTEALAPAPLGASVAVDGCCLTVVASDDASLAFQAGPETLSRTTLGRLRPGDRVNLEAALRVGDPLGGHYVTGHVDGVGYVELRDDQAEWSTFWFAVPAPLTRQMASKGSVAVDGVSLTLVDVEPGRFSVALIPHTLACTTLGGKRNGDAVNIETDLLAKYVEQQLAHGPLSP